MKALFFLFIIFNSLFIFSQTKKTADVFEEAYIVTLKGDTVKGHIKLPKSKKISEIYQKINFKDKTNKVRLYTPDKINGYGYKNYYYISAFHNNKPCFFKILSKGKASLFEIIFEEMEEGLATEFAEFCVMEEKGDGQFKVLETKGIKKQLKDIFKSNKSLAQKINEQKEITVNSQTLESYFNEFNQNNAIN